MRYIILKNKISQKEIISRKKFIEKAIGVYFIANKIDEGIEFVSFPYNLYDCVILVGHNYDVSQYINSKKIKENNIAIISCRISFNKLIKQQKKIYVTYDNDGITNYYNGEEWNLNFVISKEELKILNDSGDIIERIKKYFRRIK